MPLPDQATGAQPDEGMKKGRSPDHIPTRPIMVSMQAVRSLVDAVVEAGVPRASFLRSARLEPAFVRRTSSVSECCHCVTAHMTSAAFAVRGQKADSSAQPAAIRRLHALHCNRAC
jgi:hypothetical protein